MLSYASDIFCKLCCFSDSSNTSFSRSLLTRSSCSSVSSNERFCSASTRMCSSRFWISAADTLQESSVCESCSCSFLYSLSVTVFFSSHFATAAKASSRSSSSFSRALITSLFCSCKYRTLCALKPSVCAGFLMVCVPLIPPVPPAPPVPIVRPRVTLPAAPLVSAAPAIVAVASSIPVARMSAIVWLQGLSAATKGMGREACACTKGWGHEEASMALSQRG
mmetsp:Transcript_156867/g.292725  ORF Transcript_156867/g.292725 Transcript_156867/m.292725 type:complete len:222 (-) Transcript_156867:4-669(-)